MFNAFTNVYQTSVQKSGDLDFFMVKFDDGDMLVVSGADMVLFDGTETVKSGKTYKLCPLTVGNSKKIRKLFDFTNPVSHKGHKITIGLGDRLGVASPGHIRVIRDLDVFPVLAQQSMRELNLTGRTYDDVLAAAVWAVFREGYTKGYGADGDHLKTHEEVKNALDCGFSMITLDCSEHIRNDFVSAPQSEVDAQYSQLSQTLTSAMEKEYLNKNFPLGDGLSIEYNEADFRRMVLVYLPAIDHARSIYAEFIAGSDIDFELSIDETQSTTSPQSHFFVANELKRHSVEITSLAPRFAGEFQKGIDYRGDISIFEQDFLIHSQIADKFGYKISVHSGSDKFSIFPIVGKSAHGGYHLKTAGTSWLEAIRVIAEREPNLYRNIHSFAISNLEEAKKYYHISASTEKIADIDSVSDIDLCNYLNQDDARQVLHITYGLILQAKSADNSPMFHSKIYEALRKHEVDYFSALEKHIGKHLTTLGITSNLQ
ncbi:MAG: tagaturonate epimerase family protein [Oscillospiraceae bacterium]|nr:tagaturonate epimerase family protein [Oscillospiraceae bacterium]MCL2279311.1 tagaturonate epimerase family protein [Oscillospiraceae bacterium]